MPNETNFRPRGVVTRPVAKAAPSGGWTAGDVVLLETGGAYGIVACQADGSEEIAENEIATVLLYIDRIELPTYDGAAGVFAVGDPAYWDAADGKISNDDETAANPLVGVVTKAAVSADVWVQVQFDGVLPLL